jgi:hypothetical protein
MGHGIPEAPSRLPIANVVASAAAPPITIRITARVTGLPPRRAPTTLRIASAPTTSFAPRTPLRGPFNHPDMLTPWGPFMCPWKIPLTVIVNTMAGIGSTTRAERPAVTSAVERGKTPLTAAVQPKASLDAFGDHRASPWRAEDVILYPTTWVSTVPYNHSDLCRETGERSEVGPTGLEPMTSTV